MKRSTEFFRMLRNNHTFWTGLRIGMFKTLHALMILSMLIPGAFMRSDRVQASEQKSVVQNGNMAVEDTVDWELRYSDSQTRSKELMSSAVAPVFTHPAPRQYLQGIITSEHSSFLYQSVSENVVPLQDPEPPIIPPTLYYPEEPPEQLEMMHMMESDGSGAGEPWSPADILIADESERLTEPATAFNPLNMEYMLIWEDWVGDNTLHGRSIDHAGNPVSPEFALPSHIVGDPIYPAIIYNENDNNYIVS